jgi:hypothetical protein
MLFGPTNAFSFLGESAKAKKWFFQEADLAA